jgi:hypothetical protein
MSGGMPGGVVAVAGGPVAGDVSGAACVGEAVQVLFGRPEAMQISYDVTGGGMYGSVPLVTPARQNFPQGGMYRLKLIDIPGREGVELYPTIEVGTASRRSAAYLAHNAIPVQFTEEDFDQVLSGNFVTKVIYLPDPDFQELALAGVETLVSTRLDPGLDPIIEADRRGTILAVVRIGNKDLEVPGAFNGPAGGFEGGFPGGVIEGGVIEGGVIEGGVIEGEPYMGQGEGQDPAEGGVQQAGYFAPVSHRIQAHKAAKQAARQARHVAMAGSGLYRGGYGPGGLPPALAGGGQYGMPITGTPIALPGPPHVPLGTPAGLQKHVMHNWTTRHIPDPVSKLKINVKQRPGLSYPQPPSRAWITEQTIHPHLHYGHHTFGPAPQAQHVNLHRKRGLLHSLFHRGGYGAPAGPQEYCPPQ